MKIILASSSPRRKELLSNLELDFEVMVSDADESFDGTDVYEMVKVLSYRKAKAVQDFLGENAEDKLIIGCDSVVYHNGRILGKPKNQEDAYAALKSLSGDRHSVISGLTLLYNDSIITDFEETYVQFDCIPEQELITYIASGHADDKAGSYGIQGPAGRWVKGITGCYNNVVGLPTHLLYKLATENGLQLF